MSGEGKRRERLQSQLFLRVALLVLVLIPLFGVIRYQSTRDALQEEFEQRMEGATEVLSVALREPLWEFDESQIGEAVKALSYLDELQRVHITDQSAARYEWWFDRSQKPDLLEQAGAPTNRSHRRPCLHESNGTFPGSLSQWGDDRISRRRGP